MKAEGLERWHIKVRASDVARSAAPTATCALTVTIWWIGARWLRAKPPAVIAHVAIPSANWAPRIQGRALRSR